MDFQGQRLHIETEFLRTHEFFSVMKRTITSPEHKIQYILNLASKDQETNSVTDDKYILNVFTKSI